MNTNGISPLALWNGISGILEVLPRLSPETQRGVLAIFKDVLHREGADPRLVEEVGSRDPSLDSVTSRLFEEVLLLSVLDDSSDGIPNYRAEAARLAALIGPECPRTNRYSEAGSVSRARSGIGLSIYHQKLIFSEENLPINDTFRKIEQLIEENISVPPNDCIRVALLGPGQSVADPLYARRLVEGLKTKLGRPCKLIVYERYSNPKIVSHYENLGWNPQEVELRFGDHGNFEHPQNPPAHLVLVFHPNIFFDLLYNILIQNVSQGGIVFWQQDFSTMGELARISFEMLIPYFQRGFDHLIKPVPRPVVTTFFSRFLHSPCAAFLLKKR